MAEKPGLAAVFKPLVEKYGEHIMGSAETVAIRDKRISTGSLSLDIAMGGGVPIGRTTAFWGERSGGKTSTALRIAGIFQGLCRNCWRPAKNVVAVPPTEEELSENPDARWSATGECDCYALGLMDTVILPPSKEAKEKAQDYKDRIEAWRLKMTTNSYEETVVAVVDAENSFSKEYFAYFGDPRRLLLVIPTTGEEATDIADALGASLAVDLLVIDSLAHFAPKDEVEKSSYEWQQGLQARIVNKCIRKLVLRSSATQRQHRRMTQIWINQKRMKIGVPFGDPSVKPAGEGQNFAAHVEVKFKNGKVESVSEQYGSQKEVMKTAISETFKFEIEKNKTGDQASKDAVGEYTQSSINNDVYRVGQVMEDDFIFKLTMKYLMKEEKKGYSVGGREFSSQKAILEAIQNEPEFRAIVKEALLARFRPREKE